MLTFTNGRKKWRLKTSKTIFIVYSRICIENYNTFVSVILQRLFVFLPNLIMFLIRLVELHLCNLEQFYGDYIKSCYPQSCYKISVYFTVFINIFFKLINKIRRK